MLKGVLKPGFEHMLKELVLILPLLKKKNKNSNNIYSLPPSFKQPIHEKRFIWTVNSENYINNNPCFSSFFFNFYSFLIYFFIQLLDLISSGVQIIINFDMYNLRFIFNIQIIDIFFFCDLFKDSNG